jgi:tRNA pseudouridine55 synthase
MTYAGRLDPMASGMLLILASEETKNKDKYLAQEKEYNFQVLFGFSTDTYDILGKVIFSKNNILSKKDLEEKIKNNLKSFIGKSVQKYPIYSSKTVKGKPLFTYARSGEEVEIPKKEIIIKKLELEKIFKIDNKKLLKNIEKRIKRVKGDFRQEEIMKIWVKRLHFSEKQSFYIANLKIKCSSGTYVRTIADSLGTNIGIPALAFSIKRTKVGKYKL